VSTPLQLFSSPKTLQVFAQELWIFYTPESQTPYKLPGFTHYLCTKLAIFPSREIYQIIYFFILGLLPQPLEILDGFRKYLLCWAGKFAAFQFDESAVSHLFERLKAGRKVQRAGAGLDPSIFSNMYVLYPPASFGERFRNT
jgi:hypothetical protein